MSIYLNDFVLSYPVNNAVRYQVVLTDDGFFVIDSYNKLAGAVDGTYYDTDDDAYEVANFLNINE